MKLEFYDLNELDAFLAWAGRGRVGAASDIGATPVAYEFAPTFEGAFVPVAGEVNVRTGEVDAPAAPVEDKPKRTRRTKAEIEPEHAAKAGQTAAQPQLTAQEAIAQALAAAELAKDLKAIDPATSQAASAVAGALLETAKVVADVAADALSPTDPKLLPHEFIQKRAAELGEMQAIEHLNAARNFIAKHGMPKYNESFQLCGLHANVMQFTPAECALHAAALEWLDKA